MVQFKEEIINQVLGYLATRPYSEVHQLITALLSTAVKVEEKPEENA